MSSNSSKLSEFIADTSFDDLPAKVVHEAKRCVLDTLGTILAGFLQEEAGPICRHFMGMEGKQEATLLPTGKKFTCYNTSLIHAACSCSTELTDTVGKAIAHPGNVVIPAAMAMAEREGATGRELLTAVVMGYEANVRFGACVGSVRWHDLKHFSPPTSGIFGSTAAAGKILKLNQAELSNAFGIAGSIGPITPGAVFQKGVTAKILSNGWSSGIGILSADLTKKGATGLMDIENFWLPAVSPSMSLESMKKPGYEPEKLIDQLGENYEMLEHRIKPYGCAGSMHSVIDATFKAIAGKRIIPEEIVEIIAELPWTYYVLHADEQAKLQRLNPVSVRLTLSYVVAAAIIGGRDYLLMDAYTKEAIKDPRKLDLARKVKAIHNPKYDPIYPRSIYSKVTIKTKSGTLTAEVDDAWGRPNHPITDEELAEKFRKLSERTITSSWKQVVDTVMNLDQMNNISPLILSLISKAT